MPLNKIKAANMEVYFFK